MEERFDNSINSRLPKALKGLNPLSQQIFIFLRMRKNEQWMANSLKLPLGEVKEKVSEVKSCLIKENLLYLIETPEEVSIEDPGEGAVLSIPTKTLSQEAKLIIKEFLAGMKSVYEKLPSNQKKLLMLKFSQQMSAKEILDFSIKTGVEIVAEKTLDKTNEQDIFYALNVALKNLLKGLQEYFRKDGNDFMDIETLKTILEETGI